jgi:hypothetical protein
MVTFFPSSDVGGVLGNFMNLAHLHLVLNHFPIIGTVIGLGLFLSSLVGKNEDLKRASLIVFAAVALLALPAFFSGIGAQAAIAREPAVSAALIERHEGAAMLALLFMEVTGALALVGLWRRDRIGPGKRWARNWIALLLFSAVTTGLMTRVGTTGGDIRHPEIGFASQARAAADGQESGVSAIVHAVEPSPRKFRDLMLLSKWWWAFMMDMHFIGLALLIGTVGILDVRLLGFAKQLPLAPLHRLMPWAMAGFGINTATGVLAFIGMPNFYTFDIAFWLKMLALLLLGLNAAAFYLTDAFHSVQHLEPGEDAPPLAKFFAAASLVLWFAVIALGRYIQPLSDTLPLIRGQ